MSQPPRVEVLARRVRWLDRHRRWLAILAAIVLVAVSRRELLEALGPDWPEVHATALGVIFGVVAWWSIEVAMLWVASWWETECARLERPGGLPPATIVLRRK